MSGPSTSAHDDGGSRQLRHTIRERLARGVYEREKARDPTDRDRQSSWEDLNTGRRATRLNYADELLTTIVGALDFRWSMVDSLHRGAELARANEAEATSAAAAELEELAATLSALLPKPVQ